VRTVLRWGRSAYETDADLALEAAAAERAGLAFHTAPESADAPPLDGVDVLLVNQPVRVTGGGARAVPGVAGAHDDVRVDHVDVAAAKARKVTVARCPTAPPRRRRGAGARPPARAVPPAARVRSARPPRRVGPRPAPRARPLGLRARRCWWSATG
jgi:hypothetical protein